MVYFAPEKRNKGEAAAYLEFKLRGSGILVAKNKLFVFKLRRSGMLVAMNPSGRSLQVGLAMPGRPIPVTFCCRWSWMLLYKTDNDFCLNGVTLLKIVSLYYFSRIL